MPHLAFLVFGNVVNAFLEEGLFRGVLLRQFQRRYRFWAANTLQAGLFGVWHAVWPLKDLPLGKTDPAGAVSAAAQYALASSLMGLTTGHLVRATGGLWAPLAWHTVWNSGLKALALRSGPEASTEQPGGAVFGLAVLGVLLALLYLRTRNLLLVVGVHALINTPTLLVASPVSHEIVELLAVLLLLAWPWLWRARKRRLLHAFAGTRA